MVYDASMWSLWCLHNIFSGKNLEKCTLHLGKSSCVASSVESVVRQCSIEDVDAMHLPAGPPTWGASVYRIGVSSGECDR